MAGGVVVEGLRDADVTLRLHHVTVAVGVAQSVGALMGQHDTREVDVVSGDTL
mgnify:CR=1 FL=1